MVGDKKRCKKMVNVEPPTESFDGKDLTREITSPAVGGEGGGGFDVYVLGQRVSKIIAYVQPDADPKFQRGGNITIIRGLEILLTNGQLHRFGLPHPPEYPQTVVEDFEFKSDEWCKYIYLSKVRLQGWTEDLLGGIRFRTNLGGDFNVGEQERRTEVYVGLGYINGIHGRCGAAIDKLGFHLADMPVRSNVTDFKYFIDQGRKLDKGQTVLTNLNYENKLDIPQSITFSGSKESTETNTWNNTVGITAKAETTFVTGIPRIAEGKITVGLEASYQHEWGGSVETKSTFSWECPIQVPAKTKVRAEALVINSVINVPYRAICEVEYENGDIKRGWMTGTFIGTAAHDLDIDVEGGAIKTLQVRVTYT
ncbi:MAG: ETX/MTX2 family pore-forming toxin [Methanocellales archaeon]|nr:ETX/MTX2 family pore-forming toxin [Methanocellales archaeon]MDD3291454.1 ETX/MTX2 family pore-forming toxin [Methanocellales archaeon]MDD5234656.1 ETX/MTX2 family pore-forming toxin [Methanocellales archaeon]MDD5484991.1 ETX/MTX2 family pore-forming toxin [Methanocellales archaeon]